MNLKELDAQFLKVDSPTSFSVIESICAAPTTTFATAKLRFALSKMRFRKAIRRRAQFLCAVVIAAIYGISRFTWPEIWFAVKSVWRAVWADKKGDVPHAKWVHRMRCCMKCPVYDAKAKVCGSPFSTHPELGCYCFCPLSARQSSKRCWLEENTESPEYGWKEISQ